MPATFAHPAAVVPLARKPLVFSALVVGAIVPDLEYLLRLEPVSTVSHTLSGLLLFCLPLGLLVLWLWHAFFKAPLATLLPDRHYVGLAPMCGAFSFGPTRRFLFVALSIVVGSATHLAWDLFTHSGGWAVRELGFLGAPLLETRFGPLRVYKALQHGSTLIGSLLLLALYLRWLRGRAESEAREGSPLTARVRWASAAAILLAATVGGLAGAGIRVPEPTDLDSTRRFLIEAALLGGASFLAGTSLYSAWWRLRGPGTGRDSRGGPPGSRSAVD